jgi:hypothetical protein
MVKITYAPIKELVVHEAVSVDRDDLLRERITPAGNLPLCWCEGVLFSFTSMPMTRDIAKDYLDGKIHWVEVHYTEMKAYKPVVELEDRQYNATMKIRVIDTSRSNLHLEFIKWLKTKR